MGQDIFVLVEDDEAPMPIKVVQEGLETVFPSIPRMRRLTFEDLPPLNGWEIGWPTPEGNKGSVSGEKET